MAQLTMLSGRINAVQANNLQLYPFVIFDHVAALKVDYDLSNRSKQSYVTFYVDFKPGHEQRDLKKRCEYLVRATCDLFWSDLLVHIYADGVLAYTSASHE